MKHCLVTGERRGIGLEFARQYLQRGFQVYAASRNPWTSVELERLREQHDGRLAIMQLDVGHGTSREECFQALSANTGKLDLLINSAGILSGHEQFCRPLGELDQDELCKTFLINSLAPLMIAQAAVPLLKNSEQPIVANISSDINDSPRRRPLGAIRVNRGHDPGSELPDKERHREVPRLDSTRDPLVAVPPESFGTKLPVLASREGGAPGRR